MTIDEFMTAGFIYEMDKIAASKKRKGFRKKMRTYRKRARTYRRKASKSLFGTMKKYPVLEAVGSMALLSKGLIHLAKGGMLGKALRAMAENPRAGRIGAVGMGVGTTYLGAKGLASLLNR